ncbi:MAG: hypothetical protein J5803_02125 [Desulfovibrio sp.]|nr:hypothetical protein [Desulfovibrio sp.]
MPIYSLKLHVFGQPSYFSSQESLHIGSKVIVQEEEDRLCLATVVSGPWTQLHDRTEADFPPIYRTVDENDLYEEHENELLAEDARLFCHTCIQERQLDMKLVDVEVFFDRSKIIFFFTAPTRIDFRELVKDLVRRYHTRIELRQIGVRHETQMVGAVGNCGMICCCRRYLRKFAPVTIKMAKEQNLFLNPSKISGSCGRLLCCLAYEQDNYDNFFGSCPRIGKKYKTKQGEFKVVRTNMFRNSVSYVNDANEEKELSLEEWMNLEPIRTDTPSSNEVEQVNIIPSDDLYDTTFSLESFDGYADPASEDLFEPALPKDSGKEKEMPKFKKKKKQKNRHR